MPDEDDKPLHVLAFDVDGCLFNKNYYTATKDERDIVKRNSELLDLIKESRNNYSGRIVFSGSNRQSNNSDRANCMQGVDTNGTPIFKGSSFTELPKVSDYVQGEFCPFLMADIYGGLPVGASYQAALDDSSFEKEHADWIFDHKKVSILYAQMQLIANQHKDKPIVFDFYDDRDDILCNDKVQLEDGSEVERETLLSFFTNYPELIPKNVKLRLFHYNGGIAEIRGVIQGIGEIKEDYKQTVLDMASIAFNSDERKQHYSLRGNGDVDIANVVTPENLAAWRNRANETAQLPAVPEVLPTDEAAPVDQPNSDAQSDTAAQSATGTKEKKLRVLSFDIENCLFNPRYMYSDDHDVVSQNQKLFYEISAKNKDFGSVIVMNGSTRQSKYTDFQNTLKGRTAEGKYFAKPSCFPMFEKLSQHFGASFDKFLMADIYGDVPNGTSFDLAIQDSRYEMQTEHPGWVQDDSKFSILYAQMHKIAIEHPNEQIDFDFYDDKKGLLDNLHAFFKLHSELIPKNITLILHQYDGGKVSNYASIHNEKGEPDETYKEYLKEIAADACAAKFGTGCNRIKMKDNPNSVSPENLKTLLQNTPAYVLVGSTIFYVGNDFKLQELPITNPDVLKEVFPEEEEEGVLYGSTIDHLQMITALTGHTLGTHPMPTLERVDMLATVACRYTENVVEEQDTVPPEPDNEPKDETAAISPETIVSHTTAQAFFVTNLAKLISKSEDLRKRGHPNAADKALKLHTSLENNWNEYKDNKITSDIFKERCTTAISEARPFLARHRGWKAFLDVLSMAASAIVSVFSLGRANRATGKGICDLFRVKTTSIRQLDTLQGSVTDIDKVVPPKGPGAN